MPFCITCGMKLGNGVSRCPKCGTPMPASTVQRSRPRSQNAPQRRANSASRQVYQSPPMHRTYENESYNAYPQKELSPGGLIVFIIGLCMLSFAIFTILTDMSGTWIKYTYLPPYTDHEIGIIAVLIIGIAITIIGASKMRRIVK